MNSSNLSVNKILKTNLTNWDELSPLKETQTKSIILLNQFNQFEIDETDVDVKQQDNPDILIDQNDQSNSKNLVNKVILSLLDFNHNNAEKMIFILKVNEDVNELLYNFDVNDIEDIRIEKYVNNLNSYSKKCSQITESINKALEHLNLLLNNYSQVSVKTKSLHVACEQLLNDQVIRD
jgi:hypothetical protein